MKQTKVDSVQNFLTPSKLLTSKMKPHNKPKTTLSLHQSMNNPNHPNDTSIKTLESISSPRRQRESYKKKNLNTSHQEPYLNKNEEETKRQEKNNNQSPSQNQYAKTPYNSNGFLLNNVVKDVPNQSVNFSDSRVSKNSKNSGDGNNARYKPVGNYTRSEAIVRGKDHEEKQKNDEQKRNYIVPIKKNPEISQLQMRDLMQKLIAVRNELEEQIAQLKHLLDNTSNYLENIDTEYEKIKEKILSFTSRALDASFNQYKKCLPDWTKYENVESAGLNKLAEINMTIQSYENQKSNRSEFTSTYQVQKKIQNYRHFIGDVKDARAECYSKRPGMQEEKLKKFESAVWDLGKF